LRLIVSFLVLAACTGATAPADTAPTTPDGGTSDAPPPDRALAVAMSRFVVEGDAVKTQPATVAFHDPATGRELGRLEDPESNVFHKVLPWRGGLLTIGGDKARIVSWTGAGSAWTPTVLWEVRFGGEHDRVRDLEIGDVDNDGKDELVVATHDQGVVAVLDEQDDGTWEATELSRDKDTFVHEIELGDVDGDGLLDIFATPSEPNQSSGQSQPGRVVRWELTPDGYAKSEVIAFEDTHAKEILVADLGEGPTLFVVAEGAKGPAGGLSRPARILRMSPEGADESVRTWTQAPVAALLGEAQSRFLVAADVDGDGAKELVATGMNTGLWLLDPKDGGWKAKQLDGSSGGFEQAAIVVDRAIFVASEPGHGKPRQLRRYEISDDGRSKREILHTFEGDGLVWGLADVPWNAR